MEQSARAHLLGGDTDVLANARHRREHDDLAREPLRRVLLTLLPGKTNLTLRVLETFRKNKKNIQIIS